MTQITLSLVSHTNVGKTTLARTLLRRDVGEVLDHAHVTEIGAAYELIQSGDHKLMLWDTPGFGDSARLIRRLRKKEGGLASFLTQAWDRFADRPLWCSQQAIRNIREDAQVVLYLVNASEHPEDAGYIGHELDILEWIGRPLIVLLNQTGVQADEDQLIEPWKKYLESRGCGHNVLSLDAFSRSWLRETELFDHIAALLPEADRDVMEALAKAWRERGEAAFAQCIGAMKDHLLRAAQERERLPRRLASKTEKAQTMDALSTRLLHAKRELGEVLIECHGLDGRPAADLQERLVDFEFEGDEEWNWRRSAMLGGAVSGALSGLATDFFSGGLSFGGGFVAGGIVGALSGAGLAQGMQYFGNQGEPSVGWSPQFLDNQCRECLATYLTIAHFGRGRGRFEGLESPEIWRRAVERVWREGAAKRELNWKYAHKENEGSQREFEYQLRETLREVSLKLLESGPRAEDRPIRAES